MLKSRDKWGRECVWANWSRDREHLSQSISRAPFNILDKINRLLIIRFLTEGERERECGSISFSNATTMENWRWNHRFIIIMDDYFSIKFFIRCCGVWKKKRVYLENRYSSENEAREIARHTHTQRNPPINELAVVFNELNSILTVNWVDKRLLVMIYDYAISGTA